MREAAFDVESMAKTSTKVFVMEVTGGWITAAVGLAPTSTTIPLLLLFPERPFRRGALPRSGRAEAGLARLRLRRRFGRIAERRAIHLRLDCATRRTRAAGRRRRDNRQAGAEPRPQISPGAARLSAARRASDTDLKQSYAVGKAAVEEYALKGMNGVMPGIGPDFRTAVSLEAPARTSPRSPTRKKCCRTITSRQTAWGSRRRLAPTCSR